ncbi:Tetratricopeptide repeat-containing protein [Actinobaculum suis]|uniref:Tetratricopeptide repeat protein n=1 Tax=Actinobaculum suis TaxID=1657 RepID=A0A0K9ESQ4_9ACTO|nr:tetratricopeptide repeat protein [Actinobaculum suis]KMY23219.1 hypothetical protein ACU19_05625 [Actinobaculum suis]MDY5152636.1 tetratricopeptide repeat protein [Actinobaculum suis]SDE11563.1 Tetratricopeptide repeat-containing protein [Actinobaculum suis]
MSDLLRKDWQEGTVDRPTWTADPTLGAARELLRAGFAALERGNRQEARLKYDQAVSSAAGADLAEIADAEAVTFAGIMLRDAGDMAEARRYLEKAVAASGISGESATSSTAALTERAATLCETLSGVYGNLGEFAAAATAAEDALRIVRELGMGMGREANALYNIGMAKSLAGDHAGAAEALTEGLGVAKALDGDFGWETIQQALASTLIDAGRPEEALTYLRDLEDIHVAMPDLAVSAVKCAFEEARALVALGKLEEAAASFEKAGRLGVRTEGAADIAALAFHHQAVSLAQAGKTMEAAIPMGRAADTYEAIGAQAAAAHCVGLIGDLFAEAGQSIEAAGYFREAVERLEKILHETETAAASPAPGPVLPDYGAKEQAEQDYTTPEARAAMEADLQEFKAKLVSVSP